VRDPGNADAPSLQGGFQTSIPIKHLSTAVPSRISPFAADQQQHAVERDRRDAGKEASAQSQTRLAKRIWQP